MKFNIVPPFVGKILRKLRYGLPRGLGSGGDGNMCVQHVVARALGEGAIDEPSCVDSYVRGIGVTLNDLMWSSETARAEGLKRFAIAQLGTNSDDYVFDRVEFEQRSFHLYQLLNRYVGNNSGLLDKEFKELADAYADVLIGMKTPGAEHMCMLDWSQEDLEAMEREHDEKSKEAWAQGRRTYVRE